MRRWNLPDHIYIEYHTYESLVTCVDAWQPGDPLPRGVVFDESSKLKSPTSQRSRAAQRLADRMRAKYGHDCFVLLMSGTPSPKTPLDWWSQCEIACPGFLREGSVQALERRLAFMELKEFDTGSFYARTGWRDNELKCHHCGRFAEESCHDKELAEAAGEEYHPWAKSVNEVAYLYERLKGLVTVKHKKDCLNLPEKRYRVIKCEPKANILRAAKIIAQSAPNAITAMTLLRELSDGFQYRDVADGTMKCNHCEGSGKVFEWVDPTDPDRNYRDLDILPEEYAQTLTRTEIDCPKCSGSGQMPRKSRETVEVPCPKEQALKELLTECEETGRIVIAAGFTGSVDRVTRICLKEKWHVVRLDGRGYHVEEHDGTIRLDVNPLDYWSEQSGRVAFIMHPESGGMSLTLTEARMMVYWSNSFKPEYRTQSEDRIHRKGMDENLGCEIVDLIHLPTDERTLEVIRANRKLELMTMGEVTEVFE
jgi:SNF2 family DNA or RNA helicase